MRLDQDKQIEDLANFQREMLSPKELSRMSINHLRRQGFSAADFQTDTKKTKE